MKHIDLSIVIVNYNTKDFLRDAVMSILKHTNGITYEIIVVDNNSSDNSAEMVRKEFKDDDRVVLIAKETNSGFSAANNEGVKKSQGRYVLFLNPDTLVPEKTLPYMVDFMDKHTEAGAATCYLRFPNGELDDAAHRGFPTPWNSLCQFSGLSKAFSKSNVFNGYHLGWRDLDKTHEIDSLAGAFMLVPRKAGDEVGWWDEEYFFYGEDIDFCYRLKQKGWKIFFVPEVEIQHYKGVSHGMKKHTEKISTASSETKRRSQEWRFEAMRIFYRKHYRKKYPSFLTWVVLQGINLRRWYTLKKLS